MEGVEVIADDDASLDIGVLFDKLLGCLCVAALHEYVGAGVWEEVASEEPATLLLVLLDVGEVLLQVGDSGKRGVLRL